MKAAPAEYTAALAEEWAEEVGLLSAEEWQEILAPLPPQPDSLRECYIHMISAGILSYKLHRDPMRPSLKAHRAQFQRLHRAALEMSATLLEIWCSPAHLYLTQDELSSFDLDLKYPIPLSTLVLNRLDHMVKLSRQALSDNEYLAFLRGENVGDSIQQSAEARALWETVFPFWYGTSGRLGYSYRGPLHRFVEKIQLAAGGPPVNPESLKKAVQRWKAKRGIQDRGTGGGGKRS